MIITNSRYALVGYFITSYPTRGHGIIVIYFQTSYDISEKRENVAILQTTSTELLDPEWLIVVYIARPIRLQRVVRHGYVGTKDI